MYNPLVSIVIPTYCQPEYIKRAVDSALMQDYDSIEIIVSDDSPDDETESILITYIQGSKIRYYRNEPKLGRVGNYQKSLKTLAQGEWMVNLDGDDYFVDKSFISSAVQSINGDQSIVFVIANGTIHRTNGDLVEKKIPGMSAPFRKISGKKYFQNFAFGRGFFHLTVLYRVDIARSIDFYRMDILSSDIESVLRLALLGNVILLDRNVGVWFLHQNNTSSNALLDEFVRNSRWIDSVVNFGLKNRKIGRVQAVIWSYLVKQQELSGFFIAEMRKLTTKLQYRLFLRILINFPLTAFFPVFIKKFVQMKLKEIIERKIV